MTNKSRIVSAVQATSVPLTRLEIANELGISPDSLNDTLGSLVKAGTIHVRSETPDERVLRIGSNIGRRPANLYSSAHPVPRRTVPALCEGVMTNGTKLKSARKTKVDPVEAFITEGFNSGERREKVEAIRSAVSSNLRTLRVVYTLAGVSETFARKALAAMIAAGEVEAIKKVGSRSTTFRTSAVLPAETVVAPVTVRTSKATKTASKPATDVIAAINGYVAEFAALKTENAALKTRNAELASSLAAVRSAIG